MDINGEIENEITVAPGGPDTETLLPIPFKERKGKFCTGFAGTVPEFLTKAK